MSQDQKRNSIIEAAQKRFNHFGVGKTTMNEIADDLSISKASLYYYFPDKLGLYAAVLQTIIGSEGERKSPTFDTDPHATLLDYLDIRTEFIVKHYNILEYLKTLGTDVPKELEPVFSMARGREVTAIASILARGVDLNLIKAEDPKYIAELLLDCLHGLRLAVLSQKSNFFPDKNQFYQLAEREKDVASIFYKGLSR